MYPNVRSACLYRKNITPSPTKWAGYGNQLTIDTWHISTMESYHCYVFGNLTKPALNYIVFQEKTHGGTRYGKQRNCPGPYR